MLKAKQQQLNRRDVRFLVMVGNLRNTGACLGCQKLIEIERKVADARRELERVLNERDALISVLNEHHDPFAYRFPVEIASRVFMHRQPVVPAACTSDARHKEAELIRGVLLPGRICQNWRHIVRNTSQLWTIFSTTISESNCISSISAVHDWLARSRNLPLLIELSVDSQDGPVTDLFKSAVGKVVASIADHAHQLRVLDLTLTRGFFPSVSEALLDSNLSSLDHLKIGSIDDDHGEELHLKASPRSLTVQTLCFHQLLYESMDWTQLNNVLVRTMYSADALSLFHYPTALEVCRIGALHDLQKIDEENRTTSLSLQTLDIAHYSSAFADLFSFPSLKTLRIAYPQDRSWISIQDLLRRSDCRFEKLEIQDNNQSSTGEIVDLLRLTPNLKCLSLKGEVLRGSLFSELDAATMTGGSNMSSTPTPTFLNELESLRCTPGPKQPPSLGR